MSHNHNDGRRRDAIDPAVADLLGSTQKQQEIRRKPKAEQAEIRRQAARSRVTYDIPLPVRNAVAHIAEQEGLSTSAVAALLLADGVHRYRGGRVFLGDGIKQLSSSPKYDYTVSDEAILAVLRGEQSVGV